jgi:hypothetical protein
MTMRNRIGSKEYPILIFFGKCPRGARLAPKLADTRAMSTVIFGKRSRLGETFEESFSVASDGKTRVVLVKVNDHPFIELYPRTGFTQTLGRLHACCETDSLNALNALDVARSLKPSPVVQRPMRRRQPASKHSCAAGQQTADRRIIYTAGTTLVPEFSYRAWWAGLFHSISGRLRSALWMMFPRAATKPVFQEKQRLAACEQLFLRRRLKVRCLLIAMIGPQRREIRKPQSSLLDRFASIPTLLPKHRRKTRMQR